MAHLKGLHSAESSDIKSNLLTLLNEVTSQEVLTFDNEIRHAKDKYEIFAQFEGVSAKRNPRLLERWTHYCWIRLELTYLANQKATVNKINKIQNTNCVTPVEDRPRPAISWGPKLEQFQKHIKEPNSGIRTLEIPALVDSVSLAIQEDVLRGTSIEKSIATLSNIKLQIIGTEHPTDPLSQLARNTLIDIANAMEAHNGTEKTIKELLSKLWVVDAIPPTKRNVEVEVNRNITLTLDRLYDALPGFIEAILTAYRTYYGEKLYAQYENKILQALENITCDASWPGGDADGNENVTPEAMRYAVRLYRIRAAEKHMGTLNSTIIAKSKEIERELRGGIRLLNEQLYLPLGNQSLFDQLSIIKNGSEILKTVLLFQNHASQFLIDRDFDGLVENYAQLKEHLLAIPLDNPHRAALLRILDEQAKRATQLNQLTKFSGTYKVGDKLQRGTVQEFKKFFKTYINNIRTNTKERSSGKEKFPTATETALVHFQKVLDDHGAILDQFPTLKLQMRNFGFQLRCFGLTYGLCHIRQDSSVYARVWDVLLEDIKSQAQFKDFEVIKMMNGKRYNQLDVATRTQLHKSLQDGSPQSQQLLQFVYSRHEKNIYLNDSKYKNDKNFIEVCRELDRLDGATLYDDIFENIIISNCKSSADILGVGTLLKIFPEFNEKVTVVPLLESREDLDNYEAILTEHIKSKVILALDKSFQTLKLPGIAQRTEIKSFINAMTRVTFKEWLRQNTEIAKELKKIIIEVMIGFSDTERVSGLAALITIQRRLEDISQLAQDFGVSFKQFHGPGGDYNRGGLKLRPRKGTIQGNARSVFNTLATTQRYRETQFYQAYQKESDPKSSRSLRSYPQEIQEWMQICEQQGALFYELVQDTENGLGKLFGLLLGLGSHWMVSILNSSSRATQRGIDEKHGDRTSSVQKGGTTPEKYIHPDKPRAITLTQMKEMLREFIDLWIGPGYGLRKLTQQQVEQLYDCCETIRDMFEKTVLGVAMTDLSVLKSALFADYPELIAKNAEERAKWANECLTDYPNVLKNISIENLYKNPENRPQVMIMLSRLFALLEDELEQTREFIFKINQSIHKSRYHQPNAPTKIVNATDILFHYPILKSQVDDIIFEVEPLNILFAMLNHHVANNHFLDDVYVALKDDKSLPSELSGIGRLLGNVGSGITAFRIMLPGFYENLYLDYRPNLRPGVTRAKEEAEKITRFIEEPSRRGVFKFFKAAAIVELEKVFEEKHAKYLLENKKM